MALLHKWQKFSALKKLSAGLTSIAMLSSAVVGTTFATNPAEQWMENTGGFDNYNFFYCVLQAYKTANSIEDLTEVLGPDDGLSEEGLAAITSLTCDSQSITSAKGVNKLPNLQVLSLAGNSLSSIDLSQNKKLTSLRLDNNSLTSLDVSKNVNLESLLLANNSIDSIDLTNNRVLNQFYASDATVITGDRAKKTNTGYTFNLLGLNCFGGSLSNWHVVPSDKYTYDAETKLITIPKREDLADGFQLTYIEDGGYPDSTITISANPANINVKTNIGNVHIRSIAEKYPNEIWDSDDYMDVVSTELAAQGIEGAKLNKVEAFNYSSFYYDERPNVNVGISDDSTDTHVYGTILASLAHPNVEIVYYFEEPEESSDMNAPDTGLFTSTDKGVIAGISAASIALLAVVVYISRFVVNRQKAKVHFNKK